MYLYHALFRFSIVLIEYCDLICKNLEVTNFKIVGITRNSGVGKTAISKKLGEKITFPYIDVDKWLLGSKLFKNKNNLILGNKYNNCFSFVKV